MALESCRLLTSAHLITAPAIPADRSILICPQSRWSNHGIQDQTRRSGRTKDPLSDPRGVRETQAFRTRRGHRQGQRRPAERHPAQRRHGRRDRSYPDALRHTRRQLRAGPPGRLRQTQGIQPPQLPQGPGSRGDSAQGYPHHRGPMHPAGGHPRRHDPLSHGTRRRDHLRRQRLPL